MIFFGQFLFSVVTTAIVWIGGASLGFVVYSALFSPEKIKMIAAAFEHQALRAMLTGIYSDPVFLGSALLIGVLIVLYDKLLIMGVILLWDQEDRNRSEI